MSWSWHGDAICHPATRQIVRELLSKSPVPVVLLAADAKVRAGRWPTRPAA